MTKKIDEIAVEYLPIKSLKPYPKNARTHTARQVEEISGSIQRFGFTNPVLIGKGRLVIAGHGRLEAAKKLGMATVPTISLPWLTEAQRAALTIADNRIAENAGWDGALLAAELVSIRDLGESLQGLGFTDDELAAALSTSTDGLTDPDATPALEEIPVSATGELWFLGKHRLLCGDSTVASDVDRVLCGVKPHLMVTDPPYGVKYDPSWRAEAGVNKNKGKMGKVLNDDRADWREAWALFPGDVAYVWHASLFTREVLTSLEACGFQHRSMIIWAKDRFTLGRGHYHWQHEPCWYVVKDGGKGHWNGDRSQSTVWNIKAREDSGVGHGTQKPVECMKRPIENNSSPGQAVYEPFSGSGTTIIAAETTGRSCHAIELNPLYVDVAVRRWQDFTGQQATLEGGDSFAEVAQRRSK